jgi:hypothetical protein
MNEIAAFNPSAAKVAENYLSFASRYQAFHANTIMNIIAPLTTFTPPPPPINPLKRFRPSDVLELDEAQLQKFKIIKNISSRIL